MSDVNNAKVKVTAKGDVHIDTGDPVPPPAPPAAPEEPPPPFGKVDPGLEAKIHDLRMKLYEAIDNGDDPGPLTERLSKMSRAAGLVEDADPLEEDTEPEPVEAGVTEDE